MSALSLLTGDAQTFIDKVWASTVHVHHADVDELSSYLTLDDVDHLLTSTAMRTPALRLAKNGTVLPSSSYTRSASLAGAPLTGLVDARKVLDLFDNGTTVVLQGLHRYWEPLTALVRGLEDELGHPCQANAYLTPPGAQGFAVHSDSHDVFVFQTHGTKQWEIHDDSGVRDVEFTPGISVYLPTGTPHAARTQDVASLHVTIGINQVTWRQLLQRITTDALADRSYDAHLPAGYLDDPAMLASGIDDRLRGLIDHLGRVDSTQAATDQTHRFLRSRSSVLRGGFADRLALDDLDDGSQVQRRRSASCVLVEDDDRLRVLLGDREISMPSRLASAMAFVAETTSFAPSDLSPWLDQQSRLVLVRRLVREGLLRITA